MNLKIYNKANSTRINNGNPAIHVHAKSGLISFNSAAVELLEIAPGYGVVVSQDTLSPRDWYICRSDDEDAFKPRLYKNNSLQFNSTKLAKKLLAMCGNAKSATLRLSNQPIPTAIGIWFLIILSKQTNPEKV